jgi:hypothetical protein
MERNLFTILRSERGNIESSALIVPLLILFLLGAQLAIAAHYRNMERSIAQDSASVRAISGEFEEGDRFIHIEGGDNGQGLDLLVTNREREIPRLLPSLFNLRLTRLLLGVNGVAVIENQR